MTRYWLTPIVQKSPLRLGASRICCESIHELNGFREAAHHLHPRLLPMFKSTLLLSDDEDQCGSELIQLELSEAEDIIFDGTPYHLSHCAQAFLDRLLDPHVARGLVLSLVSPSNRDVLTENLQVWTSSWLEWLNLGWDVILLREDGI